MRLRTGKAGENTLDRSVWKRISAAGVKGEKVTMSADPVTLKVSKIGELAVYSAVNALSAEKIRPESFRPVILLPPGTEEEELRRIMDRICRACEKENLVVEGGHTEVTSAVTRPVVIGTCTGTPMNAESGRTVRCKRKEAGPPWRALKSGQIIMTKWAAMESSCILAQDREELGNVFPETILMRMRRLGEYLSVRRDAQICAEEGADFLVDLSEGGVYAALWRLCVKARRGVLVNMADIPVLQETIELANHYDIDPYKIRSAGSLLAVTEDADTLISRLEDNGIPAVRIGELTDNNDKIVRNGDEIRYLDLPQPDELLKVIR